MCILCVIQKWSRKVATMLPWLVIPLIGLWLLSQFLPPAFRFEITSPRLACVLVLLVTLFWYEILMPQLSSWRARRNARIKERKRLEAIEMQKLKKNAVRRCRNCRTPYRDQNPSGGKFSCSYCGHKSKRPEMDLYSSPDGRFSNSGVFKDLIGKIWSDNSWICGQDWLENGGNWKKKKNSVRYLSGGNDHFLGIIWLFRKLFKISFNEDDSLSDSSSDSVAKNGENCNETRSERARRKAEEKKQARLERQQLEEEERKQREEVARLVEEQRKLRDENNKNNKKELEKKRKQRKIDNKSSSDADEVEKRVIKETQKNKKPETDNRENIKSKVVVTNNNYSKESVGARYLKGNFFGKGTNGKASSTREHKSSAVLDHTNKRDSVQPQRAFVKPNLHPDDQNQNRSTVFESQPCPPPKRSWQQLFTRSSPASSSTNTNIIITRPNGNPPTENQINSYPIPTSQGFDVPITHGLPYPNPNYPYPNTSTSNFENGPVLDNFKLDLGFLSEIGAEKPSPSPKPIKSPVSKVWNSCDEKTNLPLEDGNDKGWQMWNSSPICPDTLGLFSPQKPMLKENCNYTNGYDPWALRTSNGPSTRNGLVYGLPNGPAVNHPFHGGVWAKKENAGEGVGTTSAMIGAPGSGVGVGVYSRPPDVQSLWAYE